MPVRVEGAGLPSGQEGDHCLAETTGGGVLGVTAGRTGALPIDMLIGHAGNRCGAHPPAQPLAPGCSKRRAGVKRLWVGEEMLGHHVGNRTCNMGEKNTSGMYNKVATTRPDTLPG